MPFFTAVFRPDCPIRRGAGLSVHFTTVAGLFSRNEVLISREFKENRLKDMIVDFPLFICRAEQEDSLP